MTRPFLALAAFLILSSGAAQAGDDARLYPQRFVYPPFVLEELGPGLRPDVRVAPAVDSSRAYLLEIGEDEFSGKPNRVVRNVWDLIFRVFSMEPLRRPRVAGRELLQASARISSPTSARNYRFKKAGRPERG